MYRPVAVAAVLALATLTPVPAAALETMRISMGEGKATVSL